jgi:hypothetical protein
MKKPPRKAREEGKPWTTYGISIRHHRALVRLYREQRKMDRRGQLGERHDDLDKFIRSQISKGGKGSRGEWRQTMLPKVKAPMPSLAKSGASSVASKTRKKKGGKKSSQSTKGKSTAPKSAKGKKSPTKATKKPVVETAAEDAPAKDKPTTPSEVG